MQKIIVREIRFVRLICTVLPLENLPDIAMGPTSFCSSPNTENSNSSETFEINIYSHKAMTHRKRSLSLE